MSAETQPASVLELIGKALALVGASSLAASLFYDWGFFQALEITFLEIPSALSDHVRSSLLWFPRFALIGLTALIYELLSQRIEGGQTEQEIIAESTDPQRVRRMRQRPYPFVAAAALIPLGGYVLFGEAFIHGLPLALMVAWVLFATWAQSPQPIKARRSPKVRLSIVFAPPVFIYLFISGYIDAANLSESKTAISKLVRPDGTIEQVVILRQFERGLLLRQTSGVLAFVPWSETKRLEVPGGYKKVAGLLCYGLPAVFPAPAVSAASAAPIAAASAAASMANR